MPTFLLTSPQGKQYKVTGDGDGQAALAALQRHLGDAPLQPATEQQGASGQNDPMIAQSADGVQHHFPAGTDPAVIDGVMKQYAAQSQASAQGLKPSDGPQTSADGKVDMNGEVSLGSYAKDFGSQLVKGVAEGVPAMVTGPVAIGEAIGKGLANLQQKYIGGMSPEQIAANNATAEQDPVIQGMRQFTNIPEQVGKATGIGDAQTTPGKFANTVGKMLPGALTGPGGIVRNAAVGITSGVASEAAGELAQSVAPEWERTARLVGAISGGSFTAGSKAGAQNAMLADIQKTTPELMAVKNSAYEVAANTLGKEQVPVQNFAGMVRQTNKLTGDAGIGGVADASSRAKLGGSLPVVEEMTSALRAAVKGEAPPPTFADLETWRQNLNSVVDKSIGNDGRMGADGYFAKQVVGKIDDLVGQSPYSDARAAVVTLRKVQTLDNAIAKAQNSENYTQTLQSQFKKILNDNVTRPQFSPAEADQIRQVANGSFKGNIPALLGKLGLGADYIAGQIGRQVGGVAGEAAGMIGSNLARSALRKTGAKINDSAAQAAATRARDLTAIGNRNGIQDTITSAGRVPAYRRVITAVNANQNANQQTSDTPAWGILNRAPYASEPMNSLSAFVKAGANWVQPQNALSRFAR